MILVFVEHENGALRAASRDALAVARGVAASRGWTVDAIAIGDGAETLVGDLAGVATLHTVALEGSYAPVAWASAIGSVAAETSPAMVMAAGSTRGQEVLAHLGAANGLPMVANVVDVANGDSPIITREQWGGSILEEVRCEASPLLLTLALTAVARDLGEVTGSPVLATQEFTPSEDDLRVSVARVEIPEGSGVGLTDARIVVGGGRGVGSPEQFDIVEELAAKLGAAIGVSRAVTAAGWRPHAEQVGQTGQRIAPDIYIPCGISGASQHLVGCQGAKTLLAINADAEAPIMLRADYAVIGDLHEILPAITAELSRRGT